MRSSQATHTNIIEPSRVGTGRVLQGVSVVGESSDLITHTCVRHLELLGAEPVPGRRAETGSGTAISLHASHGSGGHHVPNLLLEDREVGVQIASGRDAGARAWEEATMQALCGLMEVHGRRAGTPRRIGLDFLSVATGTLAAQGLLAGLVGASRGQRASTVQLSAFAAGLVCMSQYVAAATTRETWEVPTVPSGVGPPFLSADGVWFELEVLDGGTWKTFWEGLGLRGHCVGEAWLPFAFRYATASSSLPPELHLTTRRSTFARMSDVAASVGASVCPLQTYEEAEACLSAASGSDGQAVWDVAPWELRPMPPSPAQFDARATATASTCELPLAGMVVMESTRRVQGPLASLLLQMMGATVVRIEQPGGDPLRGMPPLSGDCSARFVALNRGKDVVEADLKTSAGRKVVLDLAGSADVFLHNWAPGKDAEFGLELHDLVKRSPRLVYAHASGWGRYCAPGLPTGTDFMVQAHTGLADLLNPRRTTVAVVVHAHRRHGRIDLQRGDTGGAPALGDNGRSSSSGYLLVLRCVGPSAPRQAGVERQPL